MIPLFCIHNVKKTSFYKSLTFLEVGDTGEKQKSNVPVWDIYKVKPEFFAWNLCEYYIKLFKNVVGTKSLVYYKLVSTRNALYSIIN